MLGELLHAEGLAGGRPIAQQMRVLLDLLHSLRTMALNDEITGLYNRGGFLQTAARLLSVAVSDVRRAHLIYFEVEDVASLGGSTALAAAEVRARRMSHFMRELCPHYTSYDVLGRLGAREFVALTLSADPQLASHDAILRRARRTHGGPSISKLSLRVGVAHFDPVRQVALEQLIESARRAMNDHADVVRSTPSFEHASTSRPRAGAG
jgi:GGDEF domain-containing protein